MSPARLTQGLGLILPAEGHMPLALAGDSCTVPFPWAEILGCGTSDMRQEHPSKMSYAL